jgi:hypothetical protein
MAARPIGIHITPLRQLSGDRLLLMGVRPISDVSRRMRFKLTTGSSLRRCQLIWCRPKRDVSMNCSPILASSLGIGPRSCLSHARSPLDHQVIKPRPLASWAAVYTPFNAMSAILAFNSSECFLRSTPASSTVIDDQQSPSRSMRRRLIVGDRSEVLMTA